MRSLRREDTNENREQSLPPLWKNIHRLSRNGLGDICPSCGRIEAFEAAGFSPERIKELSEEIDRKEEMVRKKVEAYNAGEIGEAELFAKEENNHMD